MHDHENLIRTKQLVEVDDLEAQRKLMREANAALDILMNAGNEDMVNELIHCPQDKNLTFVPMRRRSDGAPAVGIGIRDRQGPDRDNIEKCAIDFIYLGSAALPEEYDSVTEKEKAPPVFTGVE